MCVGPRGITAHANAASEFSALGARHRLTLKPEQQLRLTAYLAAHPALDAIYRFKQRLCYLLQLKKHRTRKPCQQLAPGFLRAIYQLRQARLPQLVQLGETLPSWAAEIGTMCASPATTPSPKASIPKWRSSSAKPMAFAISKTTGLELR